MNQINPQDVVTSGLAWIAAGTTLAGALGAFAVFVIGKFRDIQTQLEAAKATSASHTVQITSQQQQIAAIGLATPTAAPIIIHTEKP